MKSASESLEDYLIIKASKQTIAVALADIEGVKPYQTATALPFTPSYFEGLVNVLDLPVAQINLAGYLDWPIGTVKSCLLINHKGLRVMLAVDEVLTSIKLAKQSLQKSSKAGFSSSFILQEENVYCLDLPALFAELRTFSLQPRKHSGEYAQLSSEEANYQQTNDFCLVQISGQLFAINLIHAWRFIETQQTLPLSDARFGAVAYALLSEENYLLFDLSKFEDTTATNSTVSMALLLDHPRFNVGLKIDRLEGVVQLSQESVNKTADGHQVLHWKGAVYQLFRPEKFWSKLQEGYLSHLPHKAPTLVNQPVKLVQMLAFKVGNSSYAVPFQHIYRIEPFQTAVAVAKHQYIRGVLSIDGQTIPLLDPFQEPIDRVSEYIVVRGSKESLFAIAVSAVDGEISIEASAIQTINSGVAWETGYFNYQQELYTVFNPSKLEFYNEQ